MRDEHLPRQNTRLGTVAAGLVQRLFGAPRAGRLQAVSDGPVRVGCAAPGQSGGVSRCTWDVAVVGQQESRCVMAYWSHYCSGCGMRCDCECDDPRECECECQDEAILEALERE